VFSLALTFFLVANPIGNAPAFVALIKDFDFQRQRIILIREALFALVLALFFQYFGEWFLGSLKIQDYAVTVTGGVLLLIIALSMIFSAHASPGETGKKKQEPFIVPIAMPLLAGPGLLATIMLKSKLEESNWIISIAILVAWVGIILVMLAAPYMKKILGNRGLLALEQVMGMLLALIGIEMLVHGMTSFIKGIE
jgi:multiple antibiotic resistance protein